jgi:hypothetical protein
LWDGWQDQKAERAEMFDRLIAKAKAKARRRGCLYDVLVPLSGGKDSTYALYLATKVYKLRTLTYTFHNGFLTQVAGDNINRALEATGADHYMFKISRQKLMRLYRHFFEHTGLFCPVCMRAISVGRIVLHRQHKIPLILRGTSYRTEEWVTPEIFQDGRLEFINNVLHKHPLGFDVPDLYVDRSLSEKFSLALNLLSRNRISIGVMDMQFPDYLDWDYDVIYKTIQRECGWERLPDRDEHIDCLVEPVVHYLRRQRVPELTPNTLRYSAMIRSGMMKRDTALRLVEEEANEALTPPPHTEHLLTGLGITAEQFAEWSRCSFRHMEFQKPGLAMRLFNLARKITSPGRDTARQERHAIDDNE